MGLGLEAFGNMADGDAHKLVDFRFIFSFPQQPNRIKAGLTTLN
jgi:hypothetical protein